MANSIFSRFFRGTLSLAFARLSLVIFGLITVMIAVRYVPPEEYGAFVLLQVILSFLSTFTNFGFSLTVPQMIAKYNEQNLVRSVINTTIWFRILTVLVTSLFILVVRFVQDFFLGATIWSELLLYLPILLILGSLEGTFEGILQGLFRFNLIGLLGTIGILINLVLTILFVGYLRLWDSGPDLRKIDPDRGAIIHRDCVL